MAEDTFTDSDGVLLATHNANWTLAKAVVGSMNSLTIQGNGVQVPNGVNLTTYYAASAVDCSRVTVAANIYTNGSFSRYGPAVRASSNVAGYSAYFYLPSGGSWRRIEIDKNNAFIQYLDVVAVQNANHVIELTASGTNPVTLTVTVDGVLVGSKSDSTSPVASGYSGMYLRTNGGSSFVGVSYWTDGVTSNQIANSVGDDLLWE